MKMSKTIRNNALVQWHKVVEIWKPFYNFKENPRGRGRSISRADFPIIDGAPFIFCKVIFWKPLMETFNGNLYTQVFTRVIKE